MRAKTHLFVATPCYGGLVTQRYMQSICALLDYGNRKGMAVSVELLGYDSLITRGRNTLVTTFLDNPTATHLMFIDADIGFTPDQVGRMLAFDKPLTAGSYPLKILHYDQAVVDRNAAGEGLDTAPAPLRRRAVRGGGLSPEGRLSSPPSSPAPASC